ncbi:unnamed protein product [Brassica oleracea]|uniref:Uncharacterized protein n=1 Tax=Brassica oleracea var. oleracea TaxID=109376 RepID=A0A0D3ARN2_BRAOL
MNNFLAFLLVITMCYGLNEACKTSRIVISNGIWEGIPLEIHCYSWGRETRDWGTQTIPYNSSVSFEFVAVLNRKRRTKYVCDLWYQDAIEPYLKIKHYPMLEVFRAGHTRKCGQFREWGTGKHGIYFRRKYSQRLGWALYWFTLYPKET